MFRFVTLFLTVFSIINQQISLDLGPAQSTVSPQQQAAQKSYYSQQQQIQALNTHQHEGAQSVTNAKSSQQKAQFSQLALKVQKGTIYEDFMFSVESGQQFIINPVIDQQIVFYMFLYAQTVGTFARISDISQESPLRVHIYEDNRNLIVNQMFFFLKFIIFNGKKGSTYLIRFYSTGRRKFVVMNMKILQTNQLQNFMNSDTIFKYSQKTDAIKKEMLGITGAFNRYHTLSIHYTKKVLQHTKKYYFSFIVQIFVGFIVSIVQIRMILKLLRGNSII